MLLNDSIQNSDTQILSCGYLNVIEVLVFNVIYAFECIFTINNATRSM